ncbi:Pumilio y domain family member 6, partial [Neolecta irregularis DAH-3]
QEAKCIFVVASVTRQGNLFLSLHVDIPSNINMPSAIPNKRKFLSKPSDPHSSEKKIKVNTSKVSKVTFPGSTKSDKKYELKMKKLHKRQIEQTDEKLNVEEGLEEANDLNLDDDEDVLDQLEESISNTNDFTRAIESGKNINEGEEGHGSAEKDTAAVSMRATDQTIEEKAEASRRAHAAQKQLAKERRALKSNAEIIAKAKYLWEQVRRRTIPGNKRQKLIEQLNETVKGQVQSIVCKHDASRIIQTLVKYSNKSQRNSIAGELKTNYVDLSKSLYGKFLVVKLLHHGTVETKQMILGELEKNILKLIRHKEASYILEEAFRDYTNSKQKNSILQDFYGPEFAVFKKIDGPRSLDDILKVNPEKREHIIRNIRENLAPIFDKGVIGFTLVHRLLFDYMTHANRAEAEASSSLILEQIPEIVHTKQGCDAAMLLFAYASPKNRKIIIKACKPYIVRMAEDEFGHMFLITILDILDDTVLSSKSIISELETKLEELCMSKYGRKVILYLLVGPSPRYFFKQNLSTLEKCHEIRKDTSKKDACVRKKELLSKISPSLLEFVKNNLKFLVRNSLACQVVMEVVLNAEANPSSILNSLAELASGDPAESQHVVHLSYACRLYKTLVQGGHFNSEGKGFETMKDLGFGNKLMDSILAHIEAWAEGDGAFTVLALLESSNVDSMKKNEIVSILNTHLDRLKNVAKQPEKKGTKLVVELLKK